ncbi:MAG: hypothetical protein K2I47_05955 [Odoribacter sp.]|nr:hypothetical protein [Odoribacter sp.]
MDLKTESSVKLLLLILLGIIVIQFILILILCSRNYVDYVNEEACYDAELASDTLKIITPPLWLTDTSFLYDDFYFEY